MASKIRSGDTVQVISGKDAGKQGRGCASTRRRAACSSRA